METEVVRLPPYRSYLMVRGIARSAVFYDNTDRDRFLDRAGRVFTEGKTACYAFALLRNHVHLLLRTGARPLSDIMRRLLCRLIQQASQCHRKGDERIPGSSDFVLKVMKAAEETWERAHALKIEGLDFAAVHQHVACLFSLNPEEMLFPGKYRHRVLARSVLCYFLVRELGMTATAVAKRLGIGQPAVSMAVARGEAIVREKGLRLACREREKAIK